MLSLCTGGISLTDIVDIFATTYDVTLDQSLRTVTGVLRANAFALEIFQQPCYDIKRKFDPFRFLYNGDERYVQSDRSHRLPIPLGLNLTITFRCNFLCCYCYQNVRDTKTYGLDITRCLSLAEEAADLGMVFFGVTGGEPTLFKGWLELLERVLVLGMIPVVTSNGSVIGKNRRIAQRLANAGMHKFTISLDSHDPDLHHVITGSHDSFDQSVQSIVWLVEAGVKLR